MTPEKAVQIAADVQEMSSSFQSPQNTLSARIHTLEARQEYLRHRYAHLKSVFDAKARIIQSAFFFASLVFEGKESAPQAWSVKKTDAAHERMRLRRALRQEDAVYREHRDRLQVAWDICYKEYQEVVRSEKKQKMMDVLSRRK
jgi:hypothetical protein